MGSLKDYYLYESHQKRSKKPTKRYWRLPLQLALSVLLIFVVASTINAEHFWGQASRYLMIRGLDAENSWFNFGDPANLTAEQPSEQEDTAPEPAIAAMTGNISFTVPASGVVVRNMVLDAAGLTTDHGILIQGAAGQYIRSAAAGQVIYLGQNESGFIVEISHSQGFSSIYQGLSELSVTAEQILTTGEIIGLSENGELLFSLFMNGEEVDPLAYLFQQAI